jgi:hypothetical protein
MIVEAVVRQNLTINRIHVREKHIISFRGTKLGDVDINDSNCEMIPGFYHDDYGNAVFEFDIDPDHGRIMNWNLDKKLQLSLSPDKRDCVIEFYSGDTLIYKYEGWELDFLNEYHTGYGISLSTDEKGFIKRWSKWNLNHFRLMDEETSCLLDKDGVLRNPESFNESDEKSI